VIYGHIDSLDSYEHLLAHPVWKQAFQWLRDMPESQAPGIVPLRGNEMFVNVHGYDPLPREQCRFESHRKYLDLQYCIRGGELIEWQRTALLETDGPYDETKDVQFYRLRDSQTGLHMTPGSFVIFYPTDAHLPKVCDGVNKSVFKLVIKVKRTLLASATSVLV